jgi:hypothetical protein
VGSVERRLRNLLISWQRTAERDEARSRRMEEKREEIRRRLERAIAEEGGEPELSESQLEGLKELEELVRERSRARRDWWSR